jgi:O-antigen/teichoic acid export membrane protein
VGVYSAAHPTAALMFVLPTALISLFLPIITGLYSQKKHEKIKKIYKTVSRWIFFVNFPIFLLMVAFSRQITGIIFGQEYVAGATALAILVFGYLVYSVAYPSNALLQMAKKTRFLFFSTLIFASSNLLLNYLLIPKYGVNGAAIAASVSYLIGSLINISFSSKLMQTSPLDKTFFKSSLAGVVAILLTYNATKLLFKPASIYTLAIMFALFLLLYLGLLFLFRSFEKDDQIMFRVILSKLRIYYK